MADIKTYDSSGKDLGLTTLSIDLVVKENSPKTYSQAVHVLLQNGRQGTVGCKTRGEVSFANRKPWKQKGTGRARAGSARSPLWRSGGVVFGPQKRTKKLAINKKQKGLVLNNIFSNILGNQSIYCFDHEFDSNQGPSTKVAYNLLKNIGLENKKVIVFVPFSDSVTGISFRNISNVNVLFFNEPNAYNLSNSDCWVFFKKDVKLFEEMVAQWN